MCLILKKSYVLCGCFFKKIMKILATTSRKGFFFFSDPLVWKIEKKNCNYFLSNYDSKFLVFTRFTRFLPKCMLFYRTACPISNLYTSPTLIGTFLFTQKLCNIWIVYPHLSKCTLNQRQMIFKNTLNITISNIQ